jgi:hypothetical protein
MKYLLILSCLLFTSVGWSKDEITGSFSCKIKDINIIRLEEGLPKTYKSIEGGKIIGENLIFSYEYDPLISYFQINNKDNFFLVTEYISKRGDPKYNEKMVYSEDHSVFLSSNELSFTLDYSNKKLTLERYYKNDWQGLFVISQFTVQVYSLDCRLTNDNLDIIINDLLDKVK